MSSGPAPPQEKRCQSDSNTAIENVLKRRLINAGHTEVKMEDKLSLPRIRQICAQLNVPTEVPREESQCLKTAKIIDGVNFGHCTTHLKMMIIRQNPIDVTKFLEKKMDGWKERVLSGVDPSITALLRIVQTSSHDPSVVKAATFFLENTPGLLPEKITKSARVEATFNMNGYTPPDLLSEKSLAILTNDEREIFLRLLGKMRDAMKLMLPAGETIDA